MGIESIRIRNLLSFDDLFIQEIKDINCIIGQNNVGKSNLLNLISYFYEKLSDNRAIPPSLHDSYSISGTISIVFDTTRIKRIVTSKQSNSPYQKHIYNTLFRKQLFFGGRLKLPSNVDCKSSVKLTLTINKDESVRWSKDEHVRGIINRLYPFFAIDTRRIDLYDWGQLWTLISQLKFINSKNLKREELIGFIDGRVSQKSSSYKDYVDKIEKITRTSTYSYQEKVLNYVKVGLEGHTFNIEGEQLVSQSDGTNSHKYLELFLNLLIALTRREFVTPTVYIDEPEIGLHPKRSEELVLKLHDVYKSFKKTKTEKEVGKYKTPYPNIIFSTHSPNIVKYVIRLFKEENEHQVLHFSKFKNKSTSVRQVKSHFKDCRFLNVFSDNEARLFFSHFILFVEGETELEVFGNLKLIEKFPVMGKVDVYRANDVMLKPINPSYSNLAIPYLIVYDSDQLVEFDSNGTLTFRKAKIDLGKLKEKYKKAYYGSKDHFTYKSVNFFLDQEKKIKTLNPDKASFKLFNYSDFIDKLNKSVLSNENVMLTTTTIEGSLISERSILIFFKWLTYVLLENLRVGGKGDVRRIIENNRRSFKKGKAIEGICSGIFSFPVYLGKLSIDDYIFTKRVKIDYIRKIKQEIEDKAFSTRELVTICRLVFEGKTETLVSRESKSGKYTQLSKEIRDMVHKIRDVYLTKFPFQPKKTSGWVTSFLNFSINYIETERCGKNNTKFFTEFNETFPELAGIIQKVSFSIE